MLQGDTESFMNRSGINLATSISGKASGGLTSDLGIPSDADPYPLNAPFSLLLRLNAGGTTEWLAGPPNAPRPLKLTGGTETDLRTLSTWTRGPGAAYPIALQANGWPGEQKQIAIHRITVRKLAAAPDKSVNYLENPNIVLQYGPTATSASTSTLAGHAVTSYPSETGSSIWYVQPPAPPVSYPEFAGDYYTARIPDTLDLAERGALGVHAMTSCADPAADYEIYCWVGNGKAGKVTMKHSYHDYNGGQAKWIRQLPLGRTMSGSRENIDVDRKMMETQFRMINHDGVYYIPVKGQSWVGKPDSITPWTEEGVEQAYDIWPAGRAVQSMVVWFARDPQNTALREHIERMIDGMLKIAIRRDGALWLPRHFYDGAVPPAEDPPSGGTAATTQASLMAGVARYYALTGYAPAREFCEGITKFWLGPATVLNEQGEWLWGGDGTHYHGTTMILIGLLEWARASDDAALAERVRQAFEFGRRHGDPLSGWSPEGYPAYHPNTEPCGIGDMVVLASMLSEDGLGDYWEDIEHYTRNLLAAAQITDSGFIERAAAGTPPEPALEPGYETGDNVAQRMLGTFSGMTSMEGHFQYVSSNCCTGNGNQGLYFAWSRALKATSDTLRVNLLLNRASQWGDVDSALPYRGQVDVTMKKAMRLQVRIPSWVDNPDAVICTVDAQPRTFMWSGRFIDLGIVEDGQQARIEFPQPDRSVETTIHWLDKEKMPTERTYTLRMRGWDIVDISPRDPGLPFAFFTDEAKRHDEIRYKTVTRFAPQQEGYF